MRKVLLFVVLLMVQYNYAQEIAPPTDWRCEGLVGRVKKVTCTITGLNSATESVSTMVFNPQGYIVSEFIEDRKLGIQTVEVVSKSTLEYGEYRKNKRKIVIKSEEEQIIDQEWELPNETTLKVKKSEDPPIEIIEKRVYNAAGFLEKRYGKVHVDTDDLLDKGLERENVIIYTYEKGGINTEQKVVNTLDTTFFIYKEQKLLFDKQGNVTKKIVFEENGVPKEESQFVYEYYN